MKKIFQFISKYIKTSKKSIIVHAVIAGISYAFILKTVNGAIGGEKISSEPRLFLMLFLLIVLHIHSKKCI